ncbi:o-succinylbenzoate--CoA ligase [Gracilibacillus caseinilyticus]|uniref:2-succinylbenzoate--CoA ligase n=2 Tax=Gracilibacillus caseinilyticus TaxID=2932256 RepID=A0ABY4F2C8_9BACI|nr:o-succinylbenzoate--CoA ligase [Gracilibacillus caseinilyticus]UOQ50644.1 o-succinylbenzoate--CoA ligase [Gracilibacillus caseinilyticus]
MEHWLTMRANLSPGSTAIELDNGDTYTFLQLKQKAERFALQLSNVHQQGHLAILSDNTADMIIAFWACTYLKVPTVFLNTRLTLTEWQQQCDDADVQLLLCADGYIVGAEHLQQSVYSFSHIHTLTPTDKALASMIDMDSVCSMMFTSGTTGRAKAVMQSFQNHWSSAVASALNLGLMPTDKWLICLPLFHISGLSTLFKSVIYGMPVYLMERFEEDKVHHAIMEKQVTIISVVAVTCERLLQRLGEANYPTSFRCMLLGGGPAPKSLLEKAKQRHVPIVQSYGMTETSSQIITLNAADALRKLGSAGKPLFTSSLQIIKDNREALSNEVGEIVVKGPMVTNGYYQRVEANQKAFRDGWLYTGDLGYLDEEGFLFVVDRRSDLIISGGENIYPAEIEDVLLSCDGVLEAGVTGMKDEKWGQVPVAFVVCDSEQITSEHILAYCQERLAAFKVPKRLMFCSQLPRNATGKLQRYKLKEC